MTIAPTFAPHVPVAKSRGISIPRDHFSCSSSQGLGATWQTPWKATELATNHHSLQSVVLEGTAKLSIALVSPCGYGN